MAKRTTTKEPQTIKEITTIPDWFVEIQPELPPQLPKIASPFRMYRSDIGDNRYYYEVKEDGPAIPYISVTSFISKQTPMEEYLIKWQHDIGGLDQANYVRDREACYGTLLNTLMIQVLKENGGDFTAFGEEAFQLAMSENYISQASEWRRKIKNDIACWVYFIQERNVKWITAGFLVACPRRRVAGYLDGCFEMDFNKSRVNSIIDFKKKNYANSVKHDLQLQTYKTLWNDLYSDIFPVTHVFNWAPGNMNAVKKYDLVNRTDSVFAKSIGLRLELPVLEGQIKAPAYYDEVNGQFSLDKEFDIKNHIQRFNF